MGRLSIYIPPFAGDYSGVCSALYDFNCLIVLCDANCCTKNYIDYDEPRWSRGKTTTLCAQLRTMEVTLGDDSRILRQTAEAAQALKPDFIALLGSPVPAVIGMDLAGTCNHIESIDFTNKLPLEGMGAGVAEEFCMNWDPGKFRAEMADKDLSADPSVGGPLLELYVNADILGLHVKNVNITLNPLIASEDMPMPQWNMTIEKGNMLGQSFDIEMTTEEGVLCTTSMIIKVLEEGEKPGTSWTIKGEPNLHLDLGDICGEITTSAISVNRIPDVIAARPGIVTLKDVQVRPGYRHGQWKEI